MSQEKRLFVKCHSGSLYVRLWIGYTRIVNTVEVASSICMALSTYPFKACHDLDLSSGVVQNASRALTPTNKGSYCSCWRGITYKYSKILFEGS
jgi:hypothetical protein